MAQSVYRIITVVGSSSESWEKAAAAAIGRASKSLRDLRVARVLEHDITLKNGKPNMYRVKLELGFKLEDSGK